MTRLWLLYIVVALAVGITSIALLGEDDEVCRDNPFGTNHEDAFTTADTVEGRTVRLCCVHCYRQSPGMFVPWLKGAK